MPNLTLPLNAFIPAAGFGTRLRPLTDSLPKPLLPILGRPLLECVFDSILELPVAKIGINLHHLGEAIRKWGDHSLYRDMITWFPESPILGTGGALWNAREFLKERTFLVHNSDVISDLDMVSFLETHQKRTNLVTLATLKNGGQDHVGLDIRGQVVSVHEEGEPEKMRRRVTFTGVALYEPEFLKYLPEGESHVTRAWLAAVAAGEAVGVYDATDGQWTDLGTVEAYVDRVAKEMAVRGEEHFVGRALMVPVGCDLKGLVVLEAGAKIGIGVSIENCILLPGAQVKGGENPRNQLIYSGGAIPIKFKETDVLPDEAALRRGGSYRQYIEMALADDDLKTVLMKTDLDDPDYDRQVEYTRFFRQHRLPVPRMMRVEPLRRRIYFEDLGQIDLYDWFHKGQTEDEIRKMYKRILDLLVRFQSCDASELKSLSEWRFDRETLLWESNYFMERFVKGYADIAPEEEACLSEEFSGLADRVAAYPVRILHRDFQSRNIMLHQGDIYFIDYQSARMGPPAYDTVALTRDPYCEIPEPLVRELEEYYANRLAKKSKYPPKIIRESFVYCALQRHMQALGAYGMLSRVKGKAWFATHVPRAVRLLAQEAEHAGEDYPALERLAFVLKDKYGGQA